MHPAPFDGAGLSPIIVQPSVSFHAAAPLNSISAASFPVRELDFKLHVIRKLVNIVSVRFIPERLALQADIHIVTGTRPPTRSVRLEQGLAAIRALRNACIKNVVTELQACLPPLALSPLGQ